MSDKTKLHKVFNPEFLSVRKDIPEVQLAAAEGNLERMLELLEEDARMLNRPNRDGNTCLILAVANQHEEVASTLLEMNADIFQQNGFRMDALDYATLDSINTPIAKAVMHFCDFLTPPAFNGPFWAESDKALKLLQADRVVMLRTSIIGKQPDFGVGAPMTEYKAEWLRKLNFAVNLVNKGVLLLSDDMGYLERDAVLTGFFDVPADKRYVYNQADRQIMRFGAAMRHLWIDRMEDRFVAAAKTGNALAVQALLAAKASANLEDVQGQTVLMHASRQGDPIVVKMLVQAGARVNAVQKDGFTAMCLAATKGNGDALRLLMRAKSDTGLKSFKGNTVLDFVKHEGSRDMLDIIQEVQSSFEQGAVRKKKNRFGFGPMGRK
eukprot:TRINITY_DN93328_c0_g1_i1.p1 TRINITY_DN93328_c0_g1~~TRINITY_DN93328_c0_g1_i1.p1  ORF type:complete len:380 (-),score=86.51 TRINITY_DN93328_c0_g1_i1:190-1329(-)